MIKDTELEHSLLGRILWSEIILNIYWLQQQVSSMKLQLNLVCVCWEQLKAGIQEQALKILGFEICISLLLTTKTHYFVEQNQAVCAQDPLQQECLSVEGPPPACQ